MFSKSPILVLLLATIVCLEKVSAMEMACNQPYDEYMIACGKEKTGKKGFKSMTDIGGDSKENIDHILRSSKPGGRYIESDELRIAETGRSRTDESGVRVDATGEISGGEGIVKYQIQKGNATYATVVVSSSIQSMPVAMMVDALYLSTTQKKGVKITPIGDEVTISNVDDQEEASVERREDKPKSVKTIEAWVQLRDPNSIYPGQKSCCFIQEEKSGKIKELTVQLHRDDEGYNIQDERGRIVALMEGQENLISPERRTRNKAWNNLFQEYEIEDNDAMQQCVSRCIPKR